MQNESDSVKFGGLAGGSGRLQGIKKRKALMQWAWFFGVVDAPLMARIWRCKVASAEVSLQRLAANGVIQRGDYGSTQFRFYILTKSGAAEASQIMPEWTVYAGPPGTSRTRVTSNPAHDLLSAHLAYTARLRMQKDGMYRPEYKLELHSDRMLRKANFRVARSHIPDFRFVVRDDDGWEQELLGEQQQSSESDEQITRRVSAYAERFESRSGGSSVLIGSTHAGVLERYRLTIARDEIPRYEYHDTQRRWFTPAHSKPVDLDSVRAGFMLKEMSEFQATYYASSAVLTEFDFD